MVNCQELMFTLLDIKREYMTMLDSSIVLFVLGSVGQVDDKLSFTHAIF